jgi:hypothetical protein
MWYTQGEQQERWLMDLTKRLYCKNASICCLHVFLTLIIGRKRKAGKWEESRLVMRDVWRWVLVRSKEEKR